MKGMVEGFFVAGIFYEMDSVEEITMYFEAIDRLKERGYKESELTIEIINEEIKDYQIYLNYNEEGK